jgi:hypothetical protein
MEVVEESTSPTLFQDYSGRNFNGEAGALAVNDNWRDTTYDYVPRYAPTIAAYDVYDLSNTAHVVVSSRAQLSNALNNVGGTYTHIYCTKGTDFTDGDDNDVLLLTTSGTAEAPRYVLYYDSGNPSLDLRTLTPWDSGSYSDRCNMPRIDLTGASYTRFVGLSFGDLTSGQLGSCSIINGASSNNLWHRCNMENASIHSWNIKSLLAANNTVYQCVSHNHETQVNGGNDILCFRLSGSTNCRIISCEGWNFLGDFFHIEDSDGGSNGAILEDCDIWWDPDTYTNGSGQPGTTHHGGENAIDLKLTNPDETSTFKCYGNRVWGFRRMDTVLHPGGGSGVAVSVSNQTVSKRGIDMRWNIFFDCHDGAIALQDYLDSGFNKEHSLVRNIVADCWSKQGRAILNLPCDNTEVYMNTVSDCLGGPGHSGTDVLLWQFTNQTPPWDYYDIMGNFFQDVGVVWPTFGSNSGPNSEFGYNAWAGTYTDYSDGTYPVGYEAASKAALNMGNFTFKYKKLTSGGTDTYTINGIVPTSSTPGYGTTTNFFLVPQSGGDQVGSRIGIGVDNDK